MCSLYLDYIEYQGGDEHVVEFKVLIAQNVLEGSFGAVFSNYADVSRIDTGADKCVKVIMASLSNLQNNSEER